MELSIVFRQVGATILVVGIPGVVKIPEGPVVDRNEIPEFGGRKLLEITHTHELQSLHRHHQAEHAEFSGNFGGRNLYL
jgi:hypothetical protein